MKVSSFLKEKKKKEEEIIQSPPSINIFPSTRAREKLNFLLLRYDLIRFKMYVNHRIQILCKKPREDNANSRDNTVGKWGEPSDAHQTDNRRNLPISSTSSSLTSVF